MRKAITYGIVLVMVLMGFVALASPIASNGVPTGTIEKSMDDTNLFIGDYITITLDVTIAGGELTVYDDLPDYLGYVKGTFTVDGNPDTPSMKNGGVSITLDPGTYTIMFQVFYDSAPAESHWDVNTAYLMDGEREVGDASVDLWVRQYCGFYKGVDFLLDSDGFIVGDDGDGIIEVGEDIHWNFWITILNVYGADTMEDVMIWDRFGAELENDGDPVVTQIDADIKYKGKSRKMFLTWEVGDLIPGQDERLDMEISTDENPAGKQEYTTPDCYEMNSGAVLKFKINGVQVSAHTPNIPITVVEQDGLPE